MGVAVHICTHTFKNHELKTLKIIGIVFSLLRFILLKVHYLKHMCILATYHVVVSNRH